jgi:hypothetical protein
MRLRRPSPAMVVAIAAFVMACAGTSIAAVNYASNAGAVDGLSAVRAGSPEKAAGKLVATARSGARKGTIPNFHLSGVPYSDSFGQHLEVVDNATGGAVTLEENGFGRLTVSCSDENNAAGNENPTVNIQFTNTLGTELHFARHVGYGAATIGLIQPGTLHQLTIAGSNTFRLHLESNGTNLIYEGFARQIGAGTSDGRCLVVGTRMAIRPEK